MATSMVVRNASPARTTVSRATFEPKSISVPDSSMSIANPSEAKMGKATSSPQPPTNTGTRNRFPAASSGPKRPARTTRASGVYTALPLYGQGDWVVFKWLVFFVLILAVILAFVSWVMGVPIPGFSGFQQNPFNQ